MKWILTLSTTILLLTVSCDTSKNSTTDSQLNGNWELVIFPASTKQFEEIFGQRRPQLRFDVLNKRVTGNTGCNTISGGYSQDSSLFRFGENMIMTKMACPDYDESIFLEALNKVNRYELRNDQLTLMQDSVLIMSFAKKKV